MNYIVHHKLLGGVIPAFSFITQLGINEILKGTVNLFGILMPNWDFGDGTAKNADFVNHTYTVGGEKQVKVYFEKEVIISSFYLGQNKITGVLDLADLSKLGGDLRVNNNSNLTGLILPVTEQVFTRFWAYACGFSELDLSGLSKLGGDFNVSISPMITGLIFPVTDQIFIKFYVNNCNLTGVLDLSGLSKLGGELVANINPNLTGLILPVTDQIFTKFLVYSCNLTGMLDLSSLLKLGGEFRINNNANLTGLILPVTDQVFISFWAYACGFSELDLSGLSKLGGDLRVYSNPNLTGLIFPVTDQIFIKFYVHNCNLTGVLDLSGLSKLAGEFTIFTNPNLTGLILPITDQVFSRFEAYNCNLNQDFPLGTKIISVNIRLENNGMSASNVSSTVNNLFSNKLVFNNSIAKTLNIAGTNQAASGVYLAPADYVQANEITIGNDGTSANAKEQIYVLMNQNIDNSTVKKYKWTITYN